MRVCEILFTSNRKEGQCVWGDSSGKRGGGGGPDQRSPPVRASVIYRYETLVVSSKDIYPAKSAGYNWDAAGNSVSFTLNSTARTDAAIDYQV